MPVLANAKRALRKDRRRTIVNKRIKDKMKAAVKAVRETKLETNLPAAFQTIDRAAKQNLIHYKKAARLKSQLSKIVEKTTSKPAKASKPATPKKSTPKTKTKTTKKAATKSTKK